MKGKELKWKRREELTTEIFNQSIQTMNTGATAAIHSIRVGLTGLWPLLASHVVDVDRDVEGVFFFGDCFAAAGQPFAFTH